MKQLIILVYYINVNGLSRQNGMQAISDFMGENIISDEIKNSTNTEIIQHYIPVIGTQETRVECIYPKNITDSELIKDHIFNTTEQLNKFCKSGCGCDDNIDCECNF